MSKEDSPAEPKMEEKEGMQAKEVRIDGMTDEELAQEIKKKLPLILKMSEEKWREAVMWDLLKTSLYISTDSQVNAIGYNNFSAISKWMKDIDERLKKVEGLIEGIEKSNAENDPKKTTDHYLR